MTPQLERLKGDVLDTGRSNHYQEAPHNLNGPLPQILQPLLLAQPCNCQMEPEGSAGQQGPDYGAQQCPGGESSTNATRLGSATPHPEPGVKLDVSIAHDALHPCFKEF